MLYQPLARILLFVQLIVCAQFVIGQDRIDFVRDVQPILKAKCVRCHGPLRQESEYRVDVRQVAMQGGAGYAPNILPGNSKDSPFFQFVAGLVEDTRMPAKGEQLSSDEIETVRAWIDQGASWPDAVSGHVEDKLDWWSLRPLVAPAVAHHSLTDYNPIDTFIHAELARNNFSPTPPADKRELIRRLSFDLIGMPPTPDEVDEFLSNEEPDAYERLVDRLLASPRYGPRWARHWMDAAHFAETHGHDQDRIRENAWPYRDYLIDALNSDQSYSQFVRDQLAADVFSADEPSKIPALGFIAAGPWDESTLRDIREDTIDREIGRYVDRDDMVSNVMNNLVSLTVQCARCHDHKFDPISQADYYALQAVFAGIERANRAYDDDHVIAARRAQLARREKELESPGDQLRHELLSKTTQRELLAWEASLAEATQRWLTLTLSRAHATHGSTLTIQTDGSVLASGTLPDQDTYELQGRVSLTKVTGLRLEVMADPSLPHAGPGRQDNGNLHLSEIEFLVDNKAIALRQALADFDQTDWGIAHAIDGKPETAWGIYPKVGQAHEAVFELAEPIEITAESDCLVRLKQLHGRGHLIGRPRISLTDARPPLRPIGTASEINAILTKREQDRTDEERYQLALYWQKQSTTRQLLELPKPKLVYAAASNFEPDGSLKPPPGPRLIHILSRGDIRSPREQAQPGALACIQTLPNQFELKASDNESARRAALAAWIVDKRNPLAWRSIVNRVWQYHFSRGLVESPNDFGRLGREPSHLDLLNWLAADFRDSDQSLKRLHRHIVCSATYQQSSRADQCWQNGQSLARDDQARRLDSDNRLLWRMHRTRLDAECVRDGMLSCSGQLDLRMGGPSDRQFDLKPGRHVTPVIDYSLFDLDSPSGQRRGIYRFLFRTLPDPFMEALDCPAGDQITPLRTNSVTVQQVLALWNDAFVLKQAEHMAVRLEREAAEPLARVRLAIRLTLSREPQPAEENRYCRYVDKHGLANFCRLLFNTNEFMFVD